MEIAVAIEIKAPMYIDLQIVQRVDGLSCFHAISLFLSSGCASVSSFSSAGEDALVTVIIIKTCRG